MIVCEIYENSRENSARLFRFRDGHFRDVFDDVYDHLAYGLEQPHEIAEDVASWCEIASVGDDYTTDDFTVTIWAE